MRLASGEDHLVVVQRDDEDEKGTEVLRCFLIADGGASEAEWERRLRSPAPDGGVARVRWVGEEGGIYLNWYSDCTFVFLRVRDGYVLLQAQVLDEEDEAEKDWHVLGEGGA